MRWRSYHGADWPAWHVWRRRGEYDAVEMSRRSQHPLGIGGPPAVLEAAVVLEDLPLWDDLVELVPDDAANLRADSDFWDRLRAAVTVRGVATEELNDAELFDALLGTAPGVKLGGYPREMMPWTPKCPQGHTMELLVSLETNTTRSADQIWLRGDDSQRLVRGWPLMSNGSLVKARLSYCTTSEIGCPWASKPVGPQGGSCWRRSCWGGTRRKEESRSPGMPAVRLTPVEHTRIIDPPADSSYQ